MTTYATWTTQTKIWCVRQEVHQLSFLICVSVVRINACDLLDQGVLAPHLMPVALKNLMYLARADLSNLTGDTVVEPMLRG